MGEFKLNNIDPQSIGEYISALSNSACLHQKDSAYLVFGVENVTHVVKGTNFRPKKEKIGNQEIENWLATQLSPPIDFKFFEFTYDGCPVVIIKIDPTYNTPVRFKSTEYIRVGSYKKKLADHPEKERKIWKRKENEDWSAQICKNASINDLEPEAIMKARAEFEQKYPKFSEEIGSWDDITFLNKAKITVDDKITNTAILLLGRPESEHFISPSVSKITWVLKDDYMFDKDYEHFGTPFLLNTEPLFARIRNLKYRYIPDKTLFPIEITQYDPWVIREALNNCIAHQDYELKGRINVVEYPDQLIFTNLGDFIPRSVENVIVKNAPPELYRNPFLSNAVVHLNMIDTIGGGIRKMFQKQKQRFFPLPDYDLSEPARVVVKITGKVLDENYTQTLRNKKELTLDIAILLDKVQKKIKISKKEHKILKSKNLVEGRYPNLFISSKVVSDIEPRAGQIEKKRFDRSYYQKRILAFIKRNGAVTRKDIDDLLMGKFAGILNEKQKKKKIDKILYVMSKEKNLIQNTGSRKFPNWVIKNSQVSP